MYAIGAHVFQTRPQAIQYYETKVDFIRKNLETLQETIQKRQDNLNSLIGIMQGKLQAQAQAEAGTSKK
jgi:prefoldin alpha subunit